MTHTPVSSFSVLIFKDNQVKALDMLLRGNFSVGMNNKTFYTKVDKVWKPIPNHDYKCWHAEIKEFIHRYYTSHLYPAPTDQDIERAILSLYNPAGKNCIPNISYLLSTCSWRSISLR